MITALDNEYATTPSRVAFTENGNPAYDWICTNHDMDEKLVQFSFQSVVDPHMNYSQMYHQYIHLWNHCPIHQRDNLLKLFEFNRDIHHGKGLNTLSYYMLEVITFMTYERNLIPTNVYHGILQRLFQEFPGKNHTTELPYGSWKDLKHFLTLFKWEPHLLLYTHSVKNDIIDEILLTHVIPQLIRDRKNMSIQEPISLCGKWMPRESCVKHGWLARKIAYLYHKQTIQVYAKRQDIYKTYRKLITSINAYLEIPQNHMCNRTWDKINFDHVTSKTMLKYKRVFLNEDPHINEHHRKVCSQNFKNYIALKMKEKNYNKANNIMPHEMVKSLMGEVSKEEKDLVTLQWDNMMKKLFSSSSSDPSPVTNTSFLNRCVACIDVSPSMYQDTKIPLYSSIGLGLITMEISTLYRAFTFSETPSWIRIQKEDSLHQKIQTIRCAPWGSTTNIYALFEKFLQVALDNKIDDDEMREYTLVIYSDMQFDACCKEGERCLIDAVQNLYAKHGYNTIPFLLFWNLRATNHFPSIQTTPHCLKLSGNNATLLQSIVNLSLDELRKVNNWTLIQTQLRSPRYDLDTFQ